MDFKIRFGKTDLKSCKIFVKAKRTLVRVKIWKRELKIVILFTLKLQTLIDSF